MSENSYLNNPSFQASLFYQRLLSQAHIRSKQQHILFVLLSDH